ncbi:aminoglycoside phosphotransferase family protein [Candidatus Uhrbacteria bacterium]|nr:aminoglycoside phosphotransferase family protein [Candidatus Uhrbacteria bacterium]
MNERFDTSKIEIEPETASFSENEKRVMADANLTPETLKELVSGQPFAEGSYAMLFDLKPHGRDWVAKVGRGGKAETIRGARENVTLRLLRIKGFKDAPDVHGYLAQPNVLFEEKIEGRPIDSFDERTIADLADVLASLHSIKLDAFGKPLENRKRGSRLDCLRRGEAILRNLAAAQEGNVEIVTLAKSMLEKIALEAEQVTDAFSSSDFTLVHFDLNPGNILRSEKDGSLVIIDWEQALVGDNAMDIAKLFLKCGFDARRREIFLQEYELRLPGADPGFEHRLRIYEPLVLINSVLWRLRTLADPRKQGAENEEFIRCVKSGLEVEAAKLKELATA